MTQENSSMTAILAIGYGGQDEIVRAVQNLIKEGIAESEVTQERILEKLDT